ncbi:MAG TPA: hypothetical protein VI488_21025 [Candidatus Angelobacter sp.]
MNLSFTARAFIGLVVVLGLAVLGNAILHADAINAARFIAFLLVACLAARLKVKLPGVTGTMSVNLPFVLVAIADMSLVEGLIVGCLSNLVQCLPRSKQQFNWVQALFNFNTMALAVGTTRWIYGCAALAAYIPSSSLRLAIAAAGFLLVNTVPVAIVMCLAEGKNLARTWLSIFQLTFPYFLASAGVAGLVLTLAQRLGWQVPVSILPLMFAVFYSYRRYFSSSSSAFADALRKPAQSEPTVAAGEEVRA